MRYHPLPDFYIDKLENVPSFRLVVVGKDPYPTEPVGIPFCKPNWDAMMRRGTSGSHVLSSLGYDLEIEKEKHCCPASFFVELLDDGIAFLNASYHFLGGPIRKGKHLQFLKRAYKVNRPVFARSSQVVLCGEAQKMRWCGPQSDNMKRIVHPDIRNSVSKHSSVKKEWLAAWGGIGRLDRFLRE